ncbi:MAG: baseplate assembly protein [Bacteroidetes bacterium]|nr:baseplate assembly protein [Bacteroidota bacterium]HVZ41616.1 phage baseplate assembly protein V [Candidatus Kapabacteria bacterium]
MRSYYGKYRGKVEDNKDPKKLGRIKVSVPTVLGEGKNSWAYPCTPYAGKDVGFLALPPVGANIWVEFEGGDPDYPIWVGCFWGDGEMPKEGGVPEKKIYKTDKAIILIDDKKGDVLIKVNDEQYIEMKKNEITIDDGKGPSFGIVKLSGKTVTINKDGLEVDG